MADLGIRLQLLVGSTVPRPASFAVVDALREIEVVNTDRGRDGFELKLAIGKGSQMNYGLLADGTLDPPNRVIIMVIVNALPQVLIDDSSGKGGITIETTKGMKVVIDQNGIEISPPAHLSQYEVRRRPLEETLSHLTVTANTEQKPTNRGALARRPGSAPGRNSRLPPRQPV
jgi:hypothetical protein